MKTVVQNGNREFLLENRKSLNFAKQTNCRVSLHMSSKTTKNDKRQRQNCKVSHWLRYVVHFDHWIIVALALVLTFLFSLLFDALHLKNPYEKSVSGNSLTETYYQYASSEDDIVTSDNIVVIDVGAKISRAHIANLLRQIDSLKPLAVGVDAIFPYPSNEATDNELKSALEAMSIKVVLAQMTDEDGNIIKSFFADSMQLKSGSIMLDIDDKVVHTFSPIQDGDTTMVAMLNEMWNKHYGINQGLALMETPITIDYNHDILVIMADSLGEYADDIKDHIVLIGVVSAGSDTFRVPTERSYMPGVEIHALSLETLHSTRQYPRHVSWIWNFLLAFVLCYVLEVLLSLVQTRLPDARKPWAIFIQEWVKNSYLTNIVLLPLLAIVTIFMINATLHGRYYMLTFIFTAVVLVVESRNIYKAAITALRAKYDWKILNKSLV